LYYTRIIATKTIIPTYSKFVNTFFKFIFIAHQQRRNARLKASCIAR